MISGLNLKLDEIIERIMDSQEVVKMIHYTQDNGDIMGKADLTPAEKKKLMDTKIFKYRRLPVVNEEANCYLSMCYGATAYLSKKKGKYIVTPTINIHIICHHSLCPTLNGQRELYIIDALNRALHNARGIGIGDMHCISLEPILLPSGFLGYMLTYRMSDFEQVMEE